MIASFRRQRQRRVEESAIQGPAHTTPESGAPTRAGGRCTRARCFPASGNRSSRPFGGIILVAAVAHGLQRGFDDLGGVDEPLVGQHRLDHHLRAVAEGLHDLVGLDKRHRVPDVRRRFRRRCDFSRIVTASPSAVIWSTTACAPRSGPARAGRRGRGSARRSRLRWVRLHPAAIGAGRVAAASA